MRNKVAKFLDKVIYNGNIPRSVDNFDRRIMDKYLEIGEEYEVFDIMFDHDDIKNNFYRIAYCDWDDDWFPCESFDKDESIKERYDLK